MTVRWQVILYLLSKAEIVIRVDRYLGIYFNQQILRIAWRKNQKNLCTSIYHSNTRTDIDISLIYKYYYYPKISIALETLFKGD